MRILHVLPMYYPAVRYGGPIFAVHNLCRALAARGHDVEVMTTNIDGPGVSEVALDRPVWLDEVKVRYFASNALRRLFWSPSLARALRSDVSHFDLVHLHTVYLWPTWAAARAARHHRVPYVISPRGMLVQDLIRRRSRIAKTLWIKLFEEQTLEYASAIHVTSDVEAIELNRFGWSLPLITTISNGVDDPEPIPAFQDISQEVSAATGGGPIVLYLGRLSWKKGLDRLLRAFALTESGMLVIAGTDDEKLAPRLREFARDLHIDDRVRLLPRTITGADKEYLFRAARLFVLSSYSENFGNTVLEAMRRGIPVIVTPEVGAAQIVREARGGIVADGAPEIFAAAITQLMGDSELARSMGQAGQRHVTEFYGWPRIAAQMESLYSSLKVR